MWKWYRYVIPRELDHIKNGVVMHPGSSQVVNRSHVGKFSSHYQLIMKVGRMKNHSVHIMYDLQPLSPVLYTQGCSMENLQFNSKHPATMNSMFLGTIPLPTRSIINSRCYAPILFAKSYSCYVYKFSCKPRSITFFALGIRRIHRVQEK
jgi:hypothetical protein